MNSGGRSSSDLEALRVEVITDLDTLASLQGAWHELLLRSPLSTAFVSPAWLLTWYRHFERAKGIYAITVWHRETLVGLAPFAQTAIGRGRAGFRLLVSAGTEHGDHGEPLLASDAGPVAAAIAEHLGRLVRTENAAVNLRRLYDGGATLKALDERDDIALQPMGQVAHNALVRFDSLDDPADYLDRLAREHNIPRRMRRLRERYQNVSFAPTTDDLDTPIEAMRDMLARRWKDGGGPRLFATPVLEAFTRTVLHELVGAGLGRVSTLMADGQPIAVNTIFQVGPRLISDNTAFDPDLSRYGLGQAGLYEMLRQAFDEGATEVDLRAGDFPYKRKWTNAERITRSVVLVAPGKAGELALTGRRVAMSWRARRLRRWERRTPPSR